MVEVIKTRPDLGYHITNRHSVNLLQPSFISHSSIIMHHHNYSWSTPLIPLKIGVYQGDPLSVVIFNTVINTMVEVIKTRPDLGYHITNRHSVNLLQPSFISHSSIIMHHHNFWRSFNPSTPTSRQRSIQTAGLHHLFH